MGGAPSRSSSLFAHDKALNEKSKDKEVEHEEVEVCDDVKREPPPTLSKRNESTKNADVHTINEEHCEDDLAIQVALDAELAEKIAYEMMDEEYALKLAAEEEGIHSSTPSLQHHVDIQLQQQNDELYAKKMNDLFELEEGDRDLFHNEIQRIRDLSIKAEINSKVDTDFKLLERARLVFQQQQQQKQDQEVEALNDHECKKKKKEKKVVQQPLSPTLHLSELQKEFFQHYGFVVVQNVIHPEVTKAAKQAAHALLNTDVDSIIPPDPNINNKVFTNLPESHRPEWVNCQDEQLRALFTEERNLTLCRNVVGDFDFDSHKTGGSYSFAPRFRAWDLYPPQSKHSRKALAHGLRSVCPSEPYDLNDLPAEFDCWSRQFLLSGQGLGMSFAPCTFPNWHVSLQCSQPQLLLVFLILLSPSAMHICINQSCCLLLRRWMAGIP